MSEGLGGNGYYWFCRWKNGQFYWLSATVAVTLSVRAQKRSFVPTRLKSVAGGLQPVGMNCLTGHTALC